MGRHRNDGDATGRLMIFFIRADRIGRLESIHAGHLDVHQDDVEFALMEEINGLAAIAGSSDIVASLGEHAFDDLTIGWRVFGEQHIEDPLWRFGALEVAAANRIDRCHAQSGRNRIEQVRL